MSEELKICPFCGGKAKKQAVRLRWDANPYVWVIEFERCEKPEGV